MNHASKNVFTRFLSAMLAVIMVFSLIPFNQFVVRAEAAAPAVTGEPADTITPHGSIEMSGQYSSPNGLGSPKIHMFAMDAGLSEPIDGFCLNHGDRMGHAVEGKKWSNKRPIDPGKATPFLVWYYYHVHTVKDWAPDQIKITNAWVQAVLWLARAGKLSGSDDQIAEIGGKERYAVTNGVWGTQDPNGGNGPAASKTLLLQIMDNYNKGEYGSDWKFYQYDFADTNPYSGDTVQNLMIGVPGEPTPSGNEFYLTLDKHDPDGNPMAGKTFKIYTDAECKNLLPGGAFQTVAEDGSAYGAFKIPNGAEEADVWVREEGTGATAEAATPHQVHVTKANTETNPALVPGSPFENSTTGTTPTGTTPTTSGDDDLITKLDARTKLAVGGATFLIRGEVFEEEIPDASGNPSADPVVGHQEFYKTTNALGVIHLQWADPGGEDYIPPGSYTVTEISPPPGYEKGSNPSEAHLTLHYDIKNKIQTKSGLLVFENNPYHTVQIEKWSEGTPLPGATFEIWCDGVLVATKTTGDDGKIYWTGEDGQGAKSGLYMIREIKAPDGYLLPTRTTQWINVDATDTSIFKHVVSFDNYKYPDIRIKKVSNGTNDALAGALFEVMIDGEVLGTYTTNPGGEIVIDYGTYGRFLEENNLFEGKTSWTVTVTELVAPDGYFIDDPNVQTAELKQGETLKTFTFTDTKYPEFWLWKYEEGTENPLQGAVFEVAIDGTTFGTFTTNRDGYIHITYDDYRQFIKNGNSESWTFTAREITPPDGYLIDNKDWQIIEINKGQSKGEMVFTDTKYPEIVILKIDRETGKPLPNTTFRIMIDGTSFEAEKATDEKGEIHLTYEEYGRFLDETDKDKKDWTITVTELYPTAGYNRDKQLTSGDYTQTQQLKFGQDKTMFTFEDTSFRSIKVIKKDAETNWLLSGATFVLHCIEADDPKDGANVTDRVLTTNEEGYVIFEKIPNGTYELYESSSPFGYADPDDGYWGDNEEANHRTVIVTSDNDPVIEFERYNQPQSGLLIRKIDAVTKQPIPNVRFLITPHSPLTKEPWEATTNDNGVIVEENLPLGTYTIKEIATVDGYVLNEQSQTISIDNQHDAYTVTFENNQKNMLNILKLDANTRQPLQGAMFEIRTPGGAVIKQVTTGMYGYASIPNLEPGSYVVQEIMSPLGYEIDPMPQTFEVSEDESGKVITLIFCNSPYANLYIRKYDEVTNKGIEGAQFKVWRGDGTVIREQAITDASGFIWIGELTTDTIYVQEIKAPEGYILDDSIHTIHVTTGQNYTLEIPNKKPGGVTVTKVDAKTGAALAGAEFALTSITGDLISKQTTGKDGIARWANIDPGWYVLTETKAPEGYIISSPASRNVEVKEFVSTQITWENGQNATLTIIKRDKETEEPVYGAVFEVRTMGGDVAETLTTDVTGNATTDRLSPGWYRVVEVKAPDGYILNTEEQTVEIKENTPATLNFYNTPSKGITIHKVDAVTKLPLAGAVLEIRDAGNKLIEDYTTDASGTINTKALEPGYYNVVETKAPDGYVLDSTPHQIEVVEGKQSVITIDNYPETVIQVYKVDAITKDPLAFAEFEVSTYAGKIVGYLTTDETGWGSSMVLEPGEYVVKETKAPTGYSVDPTAHRATVEKGKNTILRLEDYPDTVLHITKVDKVSRNPLEGAEFELRYDTGHGDCTYIGTYITDKFGMIHTEPLTPGFYMIKETVAPEGYDIRTEEYRYCVKAGEYNHLVVEDIQLGSVIVRKIDSKTGKPIPGAVFKLENADTSDLVGTLETDAQGEAVWTGLKEGFYIVTETQAPEGYTKSECPKTIQVEYGKNTYVDFKDDENGSLVIILQDKHTGDFLMGGQFQVIRMSDQIIVYDGSTDVTGTIVVGNLLPGWYEVNQVFAPDMYSMVDITTKVQILVGQQQTVYFKDETAQMVIEKVDALHPELMLEGARFQVKRDSDGIVVGEYRTGKDGLALVGGLSDGLYTVTELVAPVGYAIDEGPKTVHVRGGTAAHVNFQDTALSSISINVVDTDGKPIPGVKVEVWQQNGNLVNSYVSDTTGLIMTDKIAAGYYVLKVVSVPDGYIVSPNCPVLHGSLETTVELKNGIETTFNFDIKGSGSAKIMSVDAAGKAIAGMKVTVTTISGTKIGEYTTESDGSVIVNGLDAGWYVVTEDKAPAGYSIVTASKNIQVSEKNTVEVTFEHNAHSSISLNTIDLSTKKALPGVKVEIRTQAGVLVGNYTSDSNGYIRTEKLDAGMYIVRVTEIPAGYSINSASTTIGASLQATVEVKANEEFDMDVEFVQQGSMHISSVDLTGKVIAGMQVTVATQSGIKIGDYTTDANGLIVVNNVAAGWYVVTVTKVPAGYTIEKDSQTVEMKAGATLSVEFEFKAVTNINITMVDVESKKPVPGVKVEIWEQNGGIVGSYVSDSTGIIRTEELVKGFYIVKIVSVPAGYKVSSSSTVIDTSMQTTVELNTKVDINIDFEVATKGSVKVLSVDGSDKAVAGVKVSVSNALGVLVGEYEVSADGSVIINDLVPGRYTITEIKTPDGFIADNETQSFLITAGSTTNVTIRHSVMSKITINAADVDSGKFISGVKVEVWHLNGAIVGAFETDSTGSIITGNLADGQYVVKIVSIPNGYTLSSQTTMETTVTVKAGVSVNCSLRFSVLGSMKIVATGEDGSALAGVTVTVKTKDGQAVGEYTTSKDGSVIVTGLSAGIYVVTETAVPDGFANENTSKEIEVKVGIQAEVTFSHASKSSIIISMVDASSRKPIQGVKVEIRQLNEALIGTYTSDVDGVINTGKLTAGSYTIKVISVPEGYELSTSGSVLDSEGKTTIELKNSLTLTFELEVKVNGSLKIMSVDKDGKAVSGMTVTVTTLEGTVVGTYTTGADGSVLATDLASGWYVVKETKAPAGYTSAVTAEQRIQVSAGKQASVAFTHGQVFGLQVTTTNKQTNGKLAGAKYEIRTIDGTLIGTYTSGENGLFYVDLEPGWYVVTPVSAPSGFQFVDKTSKNIEIKADKIASIEFTVNQMSSLRVKVIDGETQKGLYNVRIQLRSSETVIKEFYTDSEGYINLDSSLLSGGYTMEMLSAPGGYVVDSIPRNVSTMFGATTEVTWALYKSGGQIQVVVKSADENATLDKPAGSVLQGAVFEITNPDTYQVVGQMISDANGVAASNALPLGRYIVKMKTAPAYYAVNESFAAEVRLKVKDDVVRVETTVSSVNLNSNIKLKSNANIKAGQTMRVDITDAKNGSDTRLDNFYLHIKVPTDAARITTLSTGTWNKSVFYSISYKTNMHDYRSLAKNLQSTNVYQYGLSTQSLGLQSGEYVTDVRMEFGTVPAGFAIVQKPAYTQYVLATVYNGYKLISRAELGGQYNTVNVSTNHIDPNNPYSSTGAIVIVGGDNAGSYGGSGNSAAVSGNSGQWSTSTGLWTTTVSSNVPMPKTLPKTGY